MFWFAWIEEHLPAASTSTISKRLGEFEEAGLISRTQLTRFSPRVEFAHRERRRTADAARTALRVGGVD